MTVQQYRPRHAKPHVSLWGRIAGLFFSCIDPREDERTIEWLASVATPPMAELAELQHTDPFRVPAYMEAVSA